MQDPVLGAPKSGMHISYAWLRGALRRLEGRYAVRILDKSQRVLAKDGGGANPYNLGHYLR